MIWRSEEYREAKSKKWGCLLFEGIKDIILKRCANANWRPIGDLKQ